MEATSPLPPEFPFLYVRKQGKVLYVVCMCSATSAAVVH